MANSPGQLCELSVTNYRGMYGCESWTIKKAAAAAAATLLQSCPTLCDPIDSSPKELMLLNCSVGEDS